MDIACIPGRKSSYSKRDLSRVPSRTFLVLQARHSLSSMQDISRVPGKTCPVLRSRQMYTPLFDEFGRSSQDLCELQTRTLLILGRSTEVAKKRHVNSQNCIRPKKNREDSSDFWTESIASAQTFFSKFWAPTKKCSRRRKHFATHERSNERGAGNCLVHNVIEA